MIERPEHTMLLTLIGAYDEALQQHSKQTAHVASAIAGHVVGYDNERYENITTAALAHDIGKIGVPRHVLNKTSSLTEREWSQVRQHPLISKRILIACNLPKAAQLAGYHHERWDGRGYPAGLAGDRIPLGARIIAVADAYATMTAQVPYQAARSQFAALAELRRNSGSQFDPELAETACRVISRQAGMLRERQNGRTPQQANRKTT